MTIIGEKRKPTLPIRNFIYCNDSALAENLCDPRAQDKQCGVRLSIFETRRQAQDLSRSALALSQDSTGDDINPLIWY
jgi:hypothetical protein